ncbi:YcaO-like family protein [Streptomyces sp. NPDC020800]|uniref:YcaO-like family protein n=1 Tax=Streptomyces sp. NPDC020800 TaxID=3365092 RepID=UPI0037ACD83D
MRARSAEETWETVAGLLPSYGITRVARLTDLDCVGLPVWTAIRPASLTLSASQGKGATDLLAKLSAVMEAIELWHVEQPPPIATRGSSVEVSPEYPLSALPLTVPYPEATLARVVWEWTTGTGLMSGEAMMVPVDLVRRRAQRPEWSPDLLRATTTGLACGNTRDEALLHALCEVVERDVLFQDEQCGGRQRTLIDPGTVDDPYAQELIDRLHAAGMATELALVDGAYGMPVCLAYLWSEDHPMVFAGGGCHSSPVIALTRALTEAAQSRLTAIAGTRDDLPSDSEWIVTAPSRPMREECLAEWPEATARLAPVVGGFAEQVREVARRVELITGYEPLAMDLSDAWAPVYAVQVVCPGTRSRIRRSMPR